MKFFKKRDKRKGSLSPDDAYTVGARNGGAGAGGGGKFGSAGYGMGNNGFGHGGGGDGYERIYGYSRGGSTTGPPAPTRRSPALLANLPDPVLDRIFTLVCPHSADETYETCEQSVIDDACMLCDLRDLAHCVAVCRRWRKCGRTRLYYSVRIDSVHYCDREIMLSERRKRRSFFDRNAMPEDTAHARLKLLCRTLRDDPTRLGALVFFLKTPYMLRESCQADLARTIAVLPNLRYVDLPEGLFMDEAAYVTLRLEVQARCHQLRKMTYMGGAERSLEALAAGQGSVWPNLEVLELVRINMDPALLRHVLGALRNLRALKVSDTKAFTDHVLEPNEMMMPLPPLEELILKNVPHVSAAGLRAYLMMQPGNRQALRVLSLEQTGVGPWQLQEILSHATSLSHLTIVDKVATSLPIAAGTHDIPPLHSNSLRTLNYEITAAPSAPPFAGGVTTSYHNYLSGSLLSGGLPNLRAVYVRDANFPDSLLGLPPPQPGFADGFGRPSSAAGSPSPNTNTGFGPSSLSSAGSPRSFLSPGNGGGGGLAGAFNNMNLGGVSTNPFQDPPPAPGQGHFRSNSGQMARQSPPQQPQFGQQQQQQQQIQKPWASAGHNPRFSSNNPFAAMLPPQQIHTLEVFTKGDDELDWSFVKVSGGGLLPHPSSPFANAGYGPGHNRGASVGGGVGSRPRGAGMNNDPERPHSSYGLSSDGAAAWAASAGARKSVFMGNGAGGFLAVPDPSAGLGGGRRGSNASAAAAAADEWPRPTSSAGEKRRDRLDLWR